MGIIRWILQREEKLRLREMRPSEQGHTALTKSSGFSLKLAILWFLRGVRACVRTRVRIFCHRPLGLCGCPTAIAAFFSSCQCSIQEGRAEIWLIFATCPGRVTKAESRQALSMRAGFSPTQASIASCKQKNNVCARAGFLSKTPRGFIPSGSGGPAPGKKPVAGAWLRP